MRSAIVFLAVAAAAWLVGVQTGFADQQTSAQQKCLTKIVKAARKIGGTQAKVAVDCVKKGARKPLPGGITIDACFSADIKNKVAKSIAKLAKAESKSCGGASDPDFAFASGFIAAVTDAYKNELIGFFIDSLSEDADAVIAANQGVDESAKCASKALKLARKQFDAMHKEFDRCLKIGLRDGSVMDTGSFAACLDAAKNDAKGKIQKTTDKVAKALFGSSCPASPLPITLFPPLDGANGICDRFGFPPVAEVADHAACSTQRMSCRFCRAASDAYALGLDCDAYDDGTVNGTCPRCQNGFVDIGEECDDGNAIDGDGCTAGCIVEYCGDGVVNNNGAEDCDPGGTADECCTSGCLFVPAGTVCSGTGEQCTAPQCDGAGSCGSTNLPNGTPCTDNDECTISSACQAGQCEPDQLVAPGEACRWAIVGSPLKNTEIRTGSDAVVTTGDICGLEPDIGINSTIGGDIVGIGLDSSGAAIRFGTTGTVDGDIITDNEPVEAANGGTLPGLSPGTDTVAAGLVVAKTPSGTFYDTTGTEPRVAECTTATNDLLTLKTTLNGLPQTADLGATYDGIPTGPAPPIVAVNAGGLNVFDLTKLTGTQSFTSIDVDGGGDPDTVIILRVAGKINTSINWSINLVNGLQAKNFMIYGQAVGGTGNCQIDELNTGGGTIFCPDTKINVEADTVWSGQLFGGAGGVSGRVRIGDRMMLTRVPFQGL